MRMPQSAMLQKMTLTGRPSNALYSKKVTRDTLLEKARGVAISERKGLCSVKTLLLLRYTAYRIKTV